MQSSLSTVHVTINPSNPCDVSHSSIATLCRMYSNAELTTAAVALDHRAGRLLLAAVLWAFIGSWAALWAVSLLPWQMPAWAAITAIMILPTVALLWQAALARTRAQSLRRARQ